MIELAEIFPHEFQALLEALRRDLRHQRTKSTPHKYGGEIHAQNQRQVLRLLEVFNPRGPHRAQYKSRENVSTI
ncbi:hypothetical protein RY831_31755 [Noviherbaspirillum sp. CPCC 100848]|uniref:Transposase n=1 Tax=Noviherbaspirillum album TaxID=3080276 RepID=A0ABU6JJ41_9BURK|nr:hypothetical protein [Noviherbaspirillum sp. CPCC 100848]MEC4723701.1 hypothetical protein [Noviherbaspirillum sp. CPCC 100848]